MGRLTNNLGLKLLALLLATLLSIYVYLFIDYPTTQSFQLPVSVRNLDSGLVIVEPNPFPKAIQVQVRGPYRLIRNPASYVPAWIDCSMVTGPMDITLQLQTPDLGDILITKQEWESLDITVEEKSQKSLDVQINRMGEISENFSISSEFVGRTSISIEGPKPAVEEVATAEVQVNVNNADTDVSAILPIVLRDSEGNKIRDKLLLMDPPEVEYTLHVIPVGSIRVLQVIPDTVGQPAEGYMLVSISADPPRVQVPSELVAGELSVVQTNPINIANAKARFTDNVQILYPFDTSSQTNLPRNCRVTLEIIPTEEIGAIVIEPALKGEGSEFEYIVFPPQFSVVSEEMRDITAASRREISAVLDVDGLGVGEYMIMPQVFLPQSLDRVKINPNLLKVTIIKREE